MRFICLLFFLFSISNAMAQPVVEDGAIKTITAKTDSSKVDLRKIDKKAINQYSKQKEFIYDDVSPKTLSLWERFWKAFWKFVEDLFRSENPSQPKATNPILTYVSLAIGMAIIIFVIIKIIGLDLKLILRKSKAVNVPYEENLENIHEIDFEEQLQAALTNKNYRFAVRLLYLRTLKHLSDKELIYWQPEKTNQAYVAEISSLTKQKEFAKLTYQFEYVWYGDFTIDNSTFDIINQSFQQFNQQTK